MTTLRDADHQDVLRHLRGIPEPCCPDPSERRRPLPESMRAAADRWELAGADLAGLADTLEGARDRLSAAAGAVGMRHRIDQIIWFARELAYRCDSGHEKPEPPLPAEPDGSEFDRGFRQLWNHLANAVERLDSDDRIPRLPWDGERFGVTWGDQDGGCYAFFLGSEGNNPRSPLADQHNRDQHDQGLDRERDGRTVDRERMHALYEAAGIYTLPRSGPGGIEGYFPATGRDAHDLFLHAGLNHAERERALEAASELVETYAAVGEEFPRAVDLPYPEPRERRAPLPVERPRPVGEAPAHLVARSAGRHVRRPEAPRRPAAPVRGAHGRDG